MLAQAQPWRYDAAITNAIPRGEIHATGFFGPWQTDSPGDSSVSGHYTFDHADLNTIKGIGGILSSVGDFKGQLDRIVVDGTTETPDFSLDTSNHPIPLHTRFHAIVDGISGDTYLEPVNATLRNSTFYGERHCDQHQRPGPHHRTGCRRSPRPGSGFSRSRCKDGTRRYDRRHQHEGKAAYPARQRKGRGKAELAGQLHAGQAFTSAIQACRIRSIC